jgi:hypothetical protein
MGFITRIGQAFSGLTNPSALTVPVTTASIGGGTLLVGIGFGVTTVSTSVSSVTDTKGNTYVRDVQANPAGFRCCELWRCASLIPLSVYDPVAGTGDQITVTLTGTESRGISAIIDQFTALNPPDNTSSFGTPGVYPLVNNFKLTGTVSAADATGGVSYSVIMTDFTVNFINQPGAFTPTGPAVLPAGGSSLQAAYNPAPVTGPVTADWSWGPQAHQFAAVLASYSPAPVLQDQAAETDDIAVAVSQQIYYGPLAPQTSLYSSAATFAHNESNSSVLVTPTVTYTWACWLWMAYPLDTPCACQINWYGASGYISSTPSPQIQSATPVLAVTSGPAVTGATHATVTAIWILGSSGVGVPAPSHSYFAAAALPQGVNWLGAAAPQDVTWQSDSGAVVATLAEWWPNYGPQNDVAGCLDGISVYQGVLY